MHEHDATNEAVGARDQRPPSLGLGRIIIALFWLLGAWIFVTAILDLFHAQGQPWGPRIVALLAGVDYLIAATALTHNGRRMRLVGWVTITLSIAIPIILWVASLGLDELNSARSAWTGFGVISITCPSSSRLSAWCGCGVQIRAGLSPSRSRWSVLLLRGGQTEPSPRRGCPQQARPGGFIRPGPRFFYVH